MLERACDVAVVGAGPAGLAAACAAAEDGARVVVLDDNPHAGGQIWRRAAGASPAPRARAWLERARAAGVHVETSATLVEAPAPDALVIMVAERVTTLRCQRLVLATGSRELFLPFPGWTLPGVTGAGGLQALAKGGWPVAGRRVVVAGSGPLLLAVAAYLRRAGARVVLLAEQAPLARLAALLPHVLARPAKARQAAGLAWSLLGVRRAHGTWPVRAEGDDRLRAVVLSDGASTRRVECDLLACGFGLVPNVEVACHLGCELSGDAVRVDGWQRASREGVLCAGEICGIGGVDVAEVEGAIVGHVAAGRQDRARRLLARRRRERRFAAALAAAFALRPQLRALPDDQTVVCRCEDVTWAEVRRFADARDAKLQTRCGMGPCQGRVCGAAGRFLLGWRHDRMRPPLFPVPVSALIESEIR